MIIETKCIGCDQFFTINEMFKALERALPALEQICPTVRDREFRGVVLLTNAFTTQQQFFFVGNLPKKDLGTWRANAMHLCRTMVRCNRKQSFGKAQDGSDVAPGGIALDPPPPIWLAFHGSQPPPSYLAVIGSEDVWVNHALALFLAVHFGYLTFTRAQEYAQAIETRNPYFSELARIANL